MAKANVLVRRIRAYERQIGESEAWFASGRDEAAAQAERFRGLLSDATGELDAFLAGRQAGPWMKCASWTEACAR